jgi:hypothetical protein
MSGNAWIEGGQEAQEAMEHEIANLKPEGGFGKLLQQILVDLHRYAVSITHVITGTLRAAQTMELDLDSLRGQIFLAEGAENPLTGQMAAGYGFIEEMRGGEHAFYDLTVDNETEEAFGRAAHFLTDEA